MKYCFILESTNMATDQMFVVEGLILSSYVLDKIIFVDINRKVER